MPDWKYKNVFPLSPGQHDWRGVLEGCQHVMEQLLIFPNRDLETAIHEFGLLSPIDAVRMCLKVITRSEGNLMTADNLRGVTIYNYLNALHEKYQGKVHPRRLEQVSETSRLKDTVRFCIAASYHLAPAEAVKVIRDKLHTVSGESDD